ncbi:MAG: ABC transporter permease subunit [Bauldia sp.]
MRNSLLIAKREFMAYFSTPLAYVFMVAFLAAAGAMPFFFGGFFSRRQADLTPFFGFHTWLFLVLIPAVGMRLWAEERRTGTIELLMTLPVTTWQAVVGKFLAAWAFTGIALALTFPIWITVNYLGRPDNGVIVASYVGSFMMAGAFLAMASCLSALTRSQVIAFVISVAGGFLLTLSGLDLVLSLFRGWAPSFIVDLVASFSFLTHFSAISKGVLDSRGVFFFLSLIALFLFINREIVDLKKAA